MILYGSFTPRWCFGLVLLLHFSKRSTKFHTADEGKEGRRGNVRTYVLLSISFTLYCYSKCILSPHVSNAVAVRGESDIGCAGVRARFSVAGVGDNFPSK